MRQETVSPDIAAVRWETIRRIRSFAVRNAPYPGSSGTSEGSGVGIVPGVGSLTVTCTKEWAERARGQKIRRRFAFKLENLPIKEKDVWRLARASHDEIEEWYAGQVK